MKYGERNFRIISENMDNFRNNETMMELYLRMGKKADIICIKRHIILPISTEILKIIIFTDPNLREMELAE